MDQTAYGCVCAPLTTNLLHVIALMAHAIVNLATLGDSVISWVGQKNPEVVCILIIDVQCIHRLS